MNNLDALIGKFLLELQKKWSSHFQKTFRKS